MIKNNLEISTHECLDCGPLKTSHFQQWCEDIFSAISPLRLLGLPVATQKKALSLVDRSMLFLKLVHLSDDLTNEKVPLRSQVFIKEAQDVGMKIRAIKSRWGFTNQFTLEVSGKKYFFEGLPRAEFLHSRHGERIDDKSYVKKILLQNGLPASPGRPFWWWQKKEALNWAEKENLFPAVVKPRSGSMGQHMTLDIKNKKELDRAISIATRFSPTFIIERYIGGAHTYRATVIDSEFVACTKRVPAHIVGDGISTVSKLIEKKNSDPVRGIAGQRDCTLYKIVLDESSTRLLTKAGYDFDSIPKEGETVYLQEKVLLDLGADIEEVTSTVHPDNLEIFRKASKIFGVYLTGLDFLAQDISLSWKEQKCSILELNSLPYIDMHHFPARGNPVNAGRAVAEMVLKHYQ